MAAENILNQPWHALVGAFTDPLQPFAGLFLGVFFIAIPTLVVAMKSQKVTPPLMTMIFASFLVSPLTGQWGLYFLIVGGVLLGMWFYLLLKGKGR